LRDESDFNLGMCYKSEDFEFDNNNGSNYNDAEIVQQFDTLDMDIAEK